MLAAEVQIKQDQADGIIPAATRELSTGSSVITRWPSSSHVQGICAAQHRLKATLDMQHSTGQGRLRFAVMWMTGCWMHSGLLVRITTQMLQIFSLFLLTSC